MRYATTPTWVYVMLIVMGVGFLAGAGAFMLFASPPTGAIVGGIWALMGAGFVFFSIRAIRTGRDDDRIRREGTAATATLLSANSTGMLINNVPQWKLRLRIDGAGASYETTMKLCTYGPPGDGATFTVRVDPVHRQHVVLADDDAAPAGGVTTTFGGLAGMDSTDLGAAIAAAIAQAGQNGTMTTTTMTVNGVPVQPVVTGAASDAADTVRLLDDLDRMHASGALGDDEFAALKRKLLGT